MSVNESTYDYNASGAPEQTDRYRYDYNTDQRPIRVYEGDTLIATYDYNSFGERIKKVVYAESGNRVTYFLYEGNQLVAEIEATDETPTREDYRQTIYLDHVPVAYLHGTETYTVQSDHLGTPHRVTDSNQQTVWAADYSPFGEAIITTERITFKHRFPGQYFDAETETHYNYFRDYDPATGRYLTSDPIGLLAGPNTFAYVGANPLNYFDSLGLQAALQAQPQIRPQGIPSQHLPNQPNFTQPGQVPTAPAANDPSHRANSITSGILRRIWSRAGPLGALTLLLSLIHI